MRLGFFATLLLASITFTANAQTRFLTTPADLRKAADGMAASIGTGNYNAAWKQMKPYSVVPPVEFDAFVAQFQSQLPTLLPRYGKAIGSEFVREDKAGESLLKLTYLAKHEKSAMRWLLVFYRGEKGWVLSDFKFDGNLNALFPGQG